MFIKCTKQRNGKTTVRIMESFREKGVIKQRSIRSLGIYSNNDEIEQAQQFAQKLIIKLKDERNPTLPGMAEIIYGEELEPDPSKKKSKVQKQKSPLSAEGVDFTALEEKARIIHGFEGVCGEVFDRIGYNEIISGTRKDTQWNDILKSFVLARIADPVSKKKTVENLLLDYSKNIPLEKVYRMMDRLSLRIDEVKKKVAKNTLSLFNHEVDVLFFDVTTLYFESFDPDELRDFGFSKDCKFKETQVVLALVTNSEGHPLSYELFPGKTSEGTTLIKVVQNLKQKFVVKNVVMVADRAMFSSGNLDLMDTEGINYVVAAKLKSSPKKTKAEILSTDYRATTLREELCWLKELEFNKRRLIVSYTCKRARKDAADRQRLIDRLMKKIKNEKLPIKNLITNQGTKKYIKVSNASAELNSEKIDQDALWDGLHGVITNIKDKTGAEILSRYHGLWKIEQAFRVNKNDLKMRPIYHWKKSRIEAHIAICFLAYSLSYHMKHTLEVNNLQMSLLELRDHLKRDQYSIIEDKKTKKRFKVPSCNTEKITAIYRAFGLCRNKEVTTL